MKKTLTITFILFYSITFSQIKLSGIISDSLGIPVPFAPIGLLSLSDSSLIKGTMTDEGGRYSIAPLPVGKFILKVAVIGYEEKIVENIIVDSSSNIDLIFNLKLTASIQSLGLVSVTAIKRLVEFKNGNVIVNVENSPLAKGNSVFDLLIKLPGVSVDNNKIMIQGKSGTIVMIDNRPQMLSGDQLINLLKSMNADLVATVEILKNPPVKYDATGTSGMINIKSKKVTISGVTGTVFSSYSQGFYERLLSGISLNYKSRKLIFYSNLSGDYGHFRTVEKFQRGFTTDSSSIGLNTENVAKIMETNLNYKAGLDWLLKKGDVIGIKVEGGPGVDISTTKGQNFVVGNNNLGFDHLDSKISQPDKWNINNFDLNYDHKIDTLGSTFSFVTDYTMLTENVSSENINEFFDLDGIQVLPHNNYRSNNKSNSNVFSGRADFVKIIDTISSFETGLKGAYSNTSNDYLFERDFASDNFYLKDTNFSNKFEYTELTYAGYFNYIRSIKKLSMQLGVRLEETILTGKDEKSFRLHKKYFNVFPNLSFDYKKNDNHDFQLNLSRRIDRPNFTDLNPFITFRDQYFYSRGNPFLLPDYANKGELSYNYKSSFSTSIAYSYIENIIMDESTQDDSTKVTLASTKNMKSCNAIEYSIFYQKDLLLIWNVSFSGFLAQMDYKGDIDGVSYQRTGITYYGTITNSILLGKKVKVEVNGMYLGPNVWGIIEKKSRWMSSFALKMSLCKEKLDLTLGVDDIFNSYKVGVETNFENQNWSFEHKADSRRFRVALNFNFGKMNIEERNINSSNEEEINRFNH